jgi:hypothetical protein
MAKGRILSLLFWGLNPLLLFLTVTGCDPCYDLADGICNCRDGLDAQRACKEQLNLGKAHKYFEIARDAAKCKEALETCSCEGILKGEDKKCLFYRDET